MDELAADRGVRAVVVTGAGSAFCSGGDTSWIASEPDATVDELRTRMIAFYRAWLSVRRLEVPTIAAVNGPAIGAGLCLALACDLRYAAQGARLGVPFVRLGMHAGMAATYLLPNVVGEAHARDLLLTGRTVDADEALRLGLVSGVLPADTFLDGVLEVAAGIAAHGPGGQPADHARAARRRSRRLRERRAVGGPRPAAHARHRRPAGGHRGRPGAAGPAVHRALSLGRTPRGRGAQKEAPCLAGAPPAFPLRAPHRVGRGPHLPTNLGAPRTEGQRSVVHPCG